MDQRQNMEGPLWPTMENNPYHPTQTCDPLQEEIQKGSVWWRCDQGTVRETLEDSETAKKKATTTQGKTQTQTKTKTKTTQEKTTQEKTTQEKTK